LESRLQQNNASLFAKFVTVRTFVNLILSRQIPDSIQVVATHSEFFTDHGTPHVERVISKLNSLSELVPDGPNEREQFFLLIGAYFHDLGMFLCRLPNEPARETRLHHHERSADLVDRLVAGNFVNLDQFEVSVTKHLVRAHRAVSLDEVPEEQSIEQSTVRTRLLAAMLRIADACDMDHTRAPEAVFRFLYDAIPSSSRQYWRQHQIVAAVNFSREHAAIVVSVQVNGGFVERFDKMRMANSVSRELQRELTSVSNVFAHYGVGLVRVEIKDFDSNHDLDLSSFQLLDSYYVLGVGAGIESIEPLHEAIGQFLCSDQGPSVVIEIIPPEGPLIIDTGFRVDPLHFEEFENASKPHIEYSKRVVTKMERITQ
jgi:predicted DNA-binding transcriptional regulator